MFGTLLITVLRSCYDSLAANIGNLISIFKFGEVLALPVVLLICRCIHALSTPAVKCAVSSDDSRDWETSCWYS